MLMNHQTGCSLLCDWTLHQITEDQTIKTKDKSPKPDDQCCHPPYLYCLSSNNQQLSFFGLNYFPPNEVSYGFCDLMSIAPSTK